MAVFKEFQVNKDHMNVNSLMKQFYRYAEELKFMFTTLEEDNFSREFLNHLEERSNKIRKFKYDMDSLEISFEDFETGTSGSLRQSQEKIDMLVTRGTVVDTMMSRMEIYGESITLGTGRLIIDAANMKLDAAGNVEFSGRITGGTINIADRFVVDALGNAYIDGELIIGLLNPSESVGAAALEVFNDDDYVIAFGGTLACGELYVAEKLTCGRVSYASDGRLKYGVENLENAVEIIKDLHSVRFLYVDSGNPGMGFVAQEVYLIQEAYNAPKMAERRGRYLQVPYEAYGAVFTKAIQENQERIDRLWKAVRGRSQSLCHISMSHP